MGAPSEGFGGPSQMIPPTQAIEGGVQDPAPSPRAEPTPAEAEALLVAQVLNSSQSAQPDARRSPVRPRRSRPLPSPPPVRPPRLTPLPEALEQEVAARQGCDVVPMEIGTLYHEQPTSTEGGFFIDPTQLPLDTTEQDVSDDEDAEPSAWPQDSNVSADTHGMSGGKIGTYF